MTKLSIAILLVMMNLSAGVASALNTESASEEKFEQSFEKYDSKIEVEGDDYRVKCAEAFYVDSNENTYLLDSYNRRLIITKDNITEYVDLKETILACDLIIRKNNIYTFDEAKEEVHIYNIKTGEFIAIETMLRDDYFKEFESTIDTVYLHTYKGNIYIIDEENAKLKSTKLKSYNAKASDGFELTEFLGKDAYGNTYWLETDITEGTMLDGTLVIIKKDISGNNVGYYVVPDECDTMPSRFAHITKNGTVYILMITKEEIKITEIDFSDELELAERQKKVTHKKGKDFGKVKLDREQVLERALDVVNFEWEFSSNNTKVKSDGSTKLPIELEYIATKNADKENWSEVVIGLPYCWGGFSSLYADRGSNNNFSTAIKNGYLAGNTRTKGSYKNKTAGLDCSGYVSLAYKFNQKYGTYGLVDISKPLKSIDELQSMDMLLSPGSHVMLFWYQISDDAFLVNEVCNRNGKAVTRIRTINWYIMNGTYEMRTAW